VPHTSATLSAGDVVGNYRILGLIGAGGMGVVYRALDMKLERTVALKFLPDHLVTSAHERERVLKEARTASSLDHTNIGVIHGFEETPSGRVYIVMAYYEGETLGHRIMRGPIPIGEVVDLAIQIAEGLGAAHGGAVIHRDMKPSNVIITQKGVAKIVDFGLARLTTSTGSTQSMSTAGTIGYMSPEQTMGKPFDQRADIWSLGVVLAEMVTGKNPFHRDTAAATIFAILNEAPQGLDETNVPIDLLRIIYHALSKEPATRYASCRELLTDLREFRNHLGPEAWEPITHSAESTASDEGAPLKPSSGLSASRERAVGATSKPFFGLGGKSETGYSKSRPSSLSAKALRELSAQASRPVWGNVGAPSKPFFGLGGKLFLLAIVLILLAALSFLPAVRDRISALFQKPVDHIAVLPFENVGNDPANEAVSAGLMDSLASRLTNLEVGKESLWVVPTSEVRRQKITDPGSALRELGATIAVQGSLQREGQTIHMTVNLIDTKTLRQIGSVRLEDRAGDFSTLEDEAVSRMAKLMKIEVTPEMLRAMGGAVNAGAYELYLKALGYTQRYDKPGNLDLAINALNNAVNTDPRFALGFAELGEAYRLKYQLDKDSKWIGEALANCNKASELNDRLPAVYVTLGHIHRVTGKYELALQEYQRALQLDPRSAEAQIGLAQSFDSAGRTADAENAFRKAIALRPDSWSNYVAFGNFLDDHQHYDEAAAQYKRAIQLTPDNSAIYLNLAAAYIDKGDPGLFAEAEQLLRKSISLDPTYAAYANLGYLDIQQRKYAEAVDAVQKALQLNDKDYLVWGNLAIACQGVGDKVGEAKARDRGIALLEQAVQTNPRDGVMQANLGLLYAQKKLRDKAISRIQSALVLSPDDPNVLESVGEAYEVLGDRASALQYIERSVERGYSLTTLKGLPLLQGLLSDQNFRPHAK
jgi:serine/threonine protein kinase/tetratricopeptide (TPR) repeat protein